MYKSYLLLILFVCIGYIAHAQNFNCPPNLDFENGNLNNWEFRTGTCCPITLGNPGPPIPSRHTLISGTGTDFYGGFPLVPPNAGNFVLMLGNGNTGSEAESARYYVRVPNGSNSIYTILYQYAVVFQDPGHSPSQQPRFYVNVYDSATGNPVPCNQFNFVASATIPGFKQSPKDPGVYYKDWSTSSIDLSNLGGTTVVVEFSTGDCALGGHFGFGYLDVSCAYFQNQSIYCKNVPTISMTAPPGFEDYDWYDSITNQFLGSGQVLTQPTPTVSKTYAVVLKPFSGFGCPDTIYTRFTTEPMTLTVDGDSSICITDSTELSVTTNSTASPFSYSWTPTTGLSCFNCANPKAAPLTTTTYYVTVADTNGCTKMDSITVKVVDSAIADLDIPLDTICMYDMMNIKNNGPNNPTTAQYLWDIDKGGTIVAGDGTQSVITSWTSEGTKTIKIAAINSICRNDDSGTVYVSYGPLAEFSTDNDVCLNQELSLRPSETIASYHWQIDGHNIADTIFKDEYKLSWGSLGPKRIYLKVVSANGCEDVKTDTVNVREYPIARIDGNINDICIGKAFTLSTIEGERYKYNWAPPQYFDDQHNRSVNGVAEDSTVIMLTVTNTWGCSSHDTLLMNVPPCCEIIMPDAFTPNNDGQNDHFKPVNTNGFQIVSFIVANRRGQVVYNDENVNTGWDGSLKGEDAGIDTYNYYVKYVCATGETKEKKGTVILLR